MNSSLLLNESFANLDNWQESVDGATAQIFLQPRMGNPSFNQVFTNISYCGDYNASSYCYRAELDTTPSLRPTLFPNSSLTYWLGFSFYVPSTWEIPRGDYKIDNFQLHGGYLDGNSPILAIRLTDAYFAAIVCGNSAYDSPESVCNTYNLGEITNSGWHDWVINSRLAYGEPTGFIKIWRNNALMCEAHNILTSFDDSIPPYLKFGSYELNWFVFLFSLMARITSFLL